VPPERVGRRSTARDASVAALVTRLERVEALSHDLAREVTRSHNQNATVRAMADAIREDADAVFRILRSEGGKRRLPRSSQRLIVLPFDPASDKPRKPQV
jgi:hypothetical protein